MSPSDIQLSRSAGILQQRRVPNHWHRDFRILSIDGGGIKGLLPVSLLALLEERYAPDGIGRYFDLVVGTSTGGIIALGLGAGMTAQEIRSMYAEHGGNVFPPLSRVRRIGAAVSSWVRARRDPAPLARMVAHSFGEKRLWESRCRLCVPSLDAEFGGEVFVFKTPHHVDYRNDWKRPMATVAMATSAAPAYLRPHRDGYNVFLDGGVWANNPIMIGVVEALSAFDVPPARIQVLSLGCVESRYSVGWMQRRLGGKLFWASNVIEAAMHFHSLSVLGQAGLLLGRDRILRLGAPHMTDSIALDDWEKAMEILPPIARRLFEDHGELVASGFLTGSAETFEPIYSPGSPPGN